MTGSLHCVSVYVYLEYAFQFTHDFGKVRQQNLFRAVLTEMINKIMLHGLSVGKHYLN